CLRKYEASADAFALRPCLVLEETIRGQQVRSSLNVGCAGVRRCSALCRMTCALAPPKPNEFTPMLSVPSGLSSVLHVTSFIFQSASKRLGLGCSMPMVAGTTRCCRLWMALTNPATPEAVSRCPILLFTE